MSPRRAAPAPPAAPTIVDVYARLSRNPDGKIEKIYSKVKVAGHVDEILDSLK